MKKLALLAALAVAAAVAFAVLGSGGVPDAPVPVAWDREVCGHCHMHVGDPRHAAQLVTEDGTVVNFDDVGCALRYLEDRHPAVHRLWFHGEGDRWIAADQAAFVRGGDSPMGSGLVAVDATTPGAISQAEAARELGGVP